MYRDLEQYLAQSTPQIFAIIIVTLVFKSSQMVKLMFPEVYHS